MLGKNRGFGFKLHGALPPREGVALSVALIFQWFDLMTC